MEPDSYKYWAFISYSHRDDQVKWPWQRRWGSWLHRSLESFRISANLVGKESPLGKIPKRLLPVFRDRDELPSSANLQDSVREALEQSRTLIVICSPDSARSQWVNEEVLTFKRLNRSNRILALIVRGEPNAEDKPGVPSDAECFCPALQYEWIDGELSSRRAEPVAADARPIGDGPRDAFLKLIAGVLGVSFDTLKRRELQRRNRRLMLASAAALLLTLIVGSLAVAALIGWDRADQLATKNKDLATQERDARLDVQLRLAEAERDKGLQLCTQGDVDRGCLWLARSLATAPADAADLRWTIRMNLAAWQRELCTLQEIFPNEGAAVSFSRDSRRFATGSVDPTAAHVRDTATGKLLSPPMPHDSNKIQLLFGADHRTILIKSYPDRTSLWKETDGKWQEVASPKAGFAHITDNNRVLVGQWKTTGHALSDAETGEELGMLATEWPDDLLISPDGKRALTMKGERAVLINLELREPIGPLVHPGRVTSNPVFAAAFSPDSQELVVGYEPNRPSGRSSPSTEVTPEAQLWDAATGAKIGEPLVHGAGEHRLEHFAFSKDGERLFTSTLRNLRVWDQSGKLLAGPLPLINYNSEFSVGDDGRLLAYIGPGREVRLWDVDTEDTIAQPLAAKLDAFFLSDVPGAEIAPDGSHVLTATPEDARLWIAPSRGRRSPPLRHSADEPNFFWLDFSLDGRRLLSSSMSSTSGHASVRVWDIAEHKPHSEPRKAPYGIQCRAISPDGRWIAVGSMSGSNIDKFQSVYLWNAETGEQTPRKLPKYEQITHWVEFSRDGKRLITVGDEGKVHVYDIEKDAVVLGPLVHSEQELEGQHLLFALSPDDKRIAVYTVFGRAISLWDLQSGKPVCPQLEQPGRIHDVKFSADGKMLAVAGTGIKLYDAATGAALAANISFPATVHEVAFSPDGTHLAAVHQDRGVRLWSTVTGKLIGNVLVHSEDPSQVIFISPGNLLLTRTARGGQLWDAKSGIPIGPLMRSAGMFTVSPDGRVIASSRGPEILLWDTPQSALDDPARNIRKVEAATGVSLTDEGLVQPLTIEEWQLRRKP